MATEWLLDGCCLLELLAGVVSGCYQGFPGVGRLLGVRGLVVPRGSFLNNIYSIVSVLECLMMADYADIFLDTNVLLDVLEDRNEAVEELFSQLVERHKNGEIQLSTSIYNITELLDKEFELSYFHECMKEKISSDVILRRRGTPGFFCERSVRNKAAIIERVNNFLEHSELHIHSSTLPIEMRETLYDILGDRGIRSQDAIIISCALHNEADYFFTNDNNLKKALLDLFYTFNLTHEQDRDTILRTVLT